LHFKIKLIQEGMNRKQAATFHQSFFPKIRIAKNEMAGLLAYLLFGAFPSVNKRTVAGITKSFSKAYSCGYSSGIAPDSLFRLTSETESSSTKSCQKYENIS